VSATVQRPAAAPAVPIAQPAELGRFVWWTFATGILFCAIYFHSKTDPGLRFAIKHSGLTNYGPAWCWQQKFGPFTPGDVAVFAFAYAGMVERLRTGRMAISTRMAWLLGLGITAVLMGVAAGIYHETASPVGDWRDLALGVLYAFALWSTVLRTDRDCYRFAQIFVVILTAYGLWQLVEYASGGGEIAFYGRTTVGDHATLEFMVAAVGVSMAMLRTNRSRFLWTAGILVGTSVVVLAFRRYAWVELATVFAAFVLFSGANRRRYLVSIGGLALACLLTIGLTWSSLDWGSRLASLDPTQTRADNIYATTNQGHINDILDGFDQVKAHPVTGLGVGVLYHGARTALWKGDAGMVHNAPVEVWIKFGLLGLGVFLAVYVILFRDIWRRRNRGRVCDLLAFGGGAFLLGNALVIATVYSWPFGAPEKAILIFTLIAMAYPPGWRASPARPAATAS
jgi:hypothetical protein